MDKIRDFNQISPTEEVYEISLNIGEWILRATLIVGFLTVLFVEVWLLLQAWSLMS